MEYFTTMQSMLRYWKEAPLSIAFCFSHSGLDGKPKNSNIGVIQNYAFLIFQSWRIQSSSTSEFCFTLCKLIQVYSLFIFQNLSKTEYCIRSQPWDSSFCTENMLPSVNSWLECEPKIMISLLLLHLETRFTYKTFEVEVQLILIFQR